MQSSLILILSTVGCLYPVPEPEHCRYDDDHYVIITYDKNRHYFHNGEQVSNPDDYEYRAGRARLLIEDQALSWQSRHELCWPPVQLVDK